MSEAAALLFVLCVVVPLLASAFVVACVMHAGDEN